LRFFYGLKPVVVVVVVVVVFEFIVFRKESKIIITSRSISFFNNSKNNNVYDYNWNSFNDEDFRRRFIIKTIVVVYVESVLLNACECHLHVL